VIREPDPRAGRGAAPAPSDDHRSCLLALGLIGALSVLRLWVAARTGLGDVEAYYWTWSRHLAPGYLDHGPAVALLIRLGTLVLGETALAIRAPFILVSATTLAGAALLARQLAGGWRAGLRAVVALLCMPIMLVGGGAANPDVPLAGLVVLFLGLLLAAVRRVEHDRPATLIVAAAGLVCGLAVCAKLFGLALLVPLAWLAWRQRARARALLAAGAAALLGALPVVLWNWQHGWATLGYHLQGRHTAPVGLSLANAGKLLGGQLAYVSPLLVVGLVAAAVSLWRGRGALPARALLVVAAPLVLAATVLILIVPGAEPHWPLPGYLPLILWLAARLGAWRARRWVRGLAAAAVVFAGLAGLALHLHVLTDLGVRLMPASYQPRYDLSNELRGWPAVADAVAASLRPTGGELAVLASSGGSAKRELVAGCHYTTCAQLTFAARRRFEVVCPSPRVDQFDLEPGGDGSARVGVDLLYVLDERFPFDADLLYQCRRVERLREVAIHRAGRLVRRFLLERCVGFAGLRAQRWPPGPAERR